MPSFQLTSFLTFLCSGRLSKMSLYMEPEHSGSEPLSHSLGKVPWLPGLSLVHLHPSGRMQSQVISFLPYGHHQLVASSQASAQPATSGA